MALRFLVILIFARVVSGADVFPGKDWERVEPAEAGLDRVLLEQARDFALKHDGAGMIVRGGKLVMSWGDTAQTFDLKSSSKSIGMTAVGLAIADQKLALSDLASKYLPDLGKEPQEKESADAIAKVTLLHLATQTAGFDKPGGFQKLLFEPGSAWYYSDAGPNYLADVITLVYQRDISELMFERVFTPIGITAKDLRWRANAFRPKEINGIARREFGSGVHANVNAMARIGLLYLREGRWGERQLLPKDFVTQSRTTADWVAKLNVRAPKEGDYANASKHYGLLWWNNSDGTLASVPRDAYWSWGLYDSVILVIPSLDLVVSRAGKTFPEGASADYRRLAPFFEPIVKAAAAPKAQAPYPPSPIIAKITWAPKETIVRHAKGSDNWPMTWADDDHLYTAYGDGNGFAPFVEKKLSLGVARVEGMPDEFRGVNLRAPSIEQLGDGKSGMKASGMLCVDGVLYMWLRNAGNSRLAVSKDHGQSWALPDWKFTTSFGCPTFLNYGKNYAGAPDDLVYTYSFDSDSAYEPADRMVLARVPRDKIADRAAYEFFVKLNSSNQPQWSSDINQRGAVFEHKSRCARGGVVYNSALKRYLWCQVMPPANVKDRADARFAGGLAVYDAPQPWGPWTTVFFEENWDTGPGETASFVSKWMSADGLEMHLVFSGDDAFSVRKAKLELRK